MVLIWEIQQATGDTTLLQDVEKRETLRDRQSIIFGAVNDQLWCAKLEDVLRSRGVPATPIVTVSPHSAIELEAVSWRVKLQDQGTHIMLNEPKFFRGYLGICNKCSVVADKCLELSAQGIALDPVDHEAAIAGTGSNAVVGVNEVKVVVDILPALDQVIVRVAPYHLSPTD